MNEHDHFSNVLDVEAHEESMESAFHETHSGFAADEDEARPRETQAPRKKKIPTLLLIAGGMVGFVVVGAGYNHFFGSHPQPAAMTAMANAMPADTGETPLPSGDAATQQGQGGMLAHGPSVPPLPSRAAAAASEPIGPIGPIPTRQNSRDMFADMSTSSAPQAPAASASIDGPTQAAGTGSVPLSQPSAMTSTAAASGASAMIASSTGPATAAMGVPGSGTNAVANAPSPGDMAGAMTAAATPDPKDVEIAKLRSQLDALRAHGRTATAAHYASKHSPHVKHLGSIRAGASEAGVTANAQAAGANSDGADDGAANATQTAANDVPAAQGAAQPRPSRHPAKHHRARYAKGPKQTGAEVLVGYKIKQVIPGQGWIEDEQTGKQQVVAVGDVIGAAKVVRIDPDNYRIMTTAGVIQ